ncbi:MAG: restriction endonuclease subunit R [Draconibacterium sp.]|nr:MAG: restriction endonuclease subunit R [Draconibacterium sp.]
MQKLNLPEYEFKIKQENSKTLIFDPVRKKYVVLTPEEWVRQNFMEYLKQEKQYPPSLMSVEKKVLVNGMAKRFDLLVYKRNGDPFLIAEFKSPMLKIGQDTFDQAVRYNMALNVDIILVSNGLSHYVCQVDYENKRYSFLNQVPEFK